MALHKDFPQSPHAILDPGIRWFPADEALRESSMEKLMPPLVAELRRKECRARCVLISAYLNDEVRQQAGTLGVDRVLEKPVDVNLLRGTLADLLPTTGNSAKIAR